jgi:hypothetical protein
MLFHFRYLWQQITFELTKKKIGMSEDLLIFDDSEEGAGSRATTEPFRAGFMVRTYFGQARAPPPPETRDLLTGEGETAADHEDHGADGRGDIPLDGADGPENIPLDDGPPGGDDDSWIRRRGRASSDPEMHAASALRAPPGAWTADLKVRGDNEDAPHLQLRCGDWDVDDEVERKVDRVVIVSIAVGFVLFFIAAAFEYMMRANTARPACVRACSGLPDAVTLQHALDAAAANNFACSTWATHRCAPEDKTPGCVCCVPNVTKDCWTGAHVKYESKEMADVTYTVVGEHPVVKRRAAVPVSARVCFDLFKQRMTNEAATCMDVEGLNVHYVYAALRMLKHQPFDGKKI